MNEALNLPRPAWMTEDVVLLEEQARRFLAAEFGPHLEKWHEDHSYPREVWTKAGAAGLLCASMPEEYGGAGGSFAHEAVIDREYSLAGFDTFGASLHSGIVAPYILRYGTEEQKRRWLPKLATGEMVGAIAMSEPGTGSDLQGVRTTAKRSGNGYVLNGSKTFITNGQHANLIIVVAKTDPKEGSKGISLMVVETDDAQGFRRGRKLKKLGMDSADTSELFFEEVSLPAESLLGIEEGQGFYQLMKDLPQERLIVSVHAVSMIERALGLTIDYVKQRGLRQKDHRLPGHPVCNGRMQERSDRCQGVPRSLHRTPRQGRARHRHRFNGEILAYRSPRQNRGSLPANVRRLRLHGRISDFAALSRCAGAAHLCRNQ
jgi:acyl-CoA dehydrogenase